MIGSSWRKYQGLASCIPGTFSAAYCTDVITHTAHHGRKPKLTSVNLCPGALVIGWKRARQILGQSYRETQRPTSIREKRMLWFEERRQRRDRPLQHHLHYVLFCTFFWGCSLQAKSLALGPLPAPHGHQQFGVSLGPVAQEGPSMTSRPPYCWSSHYRLVGNL